MGPPGAPGVRHAATGALRELTSLGRGQGGAATAAPEREDFSDSNFDEWSGFGGAASGGFVGGASNNDAEDTEADTVFTKVEDFMDGRRKKKREEKQKELEQQIAKDRLNKQDYQTQFQDLKRHLASVTRIEWESLPEAPDLVKRSKKQRELVQNQRFVPVPDSIISSARMDTQSATFIDPSQSSGITSTIGGTSGFTSVMNSGMMSVAGTNLTELGQARGQLLSIKLDKAQSDSVIGSASTFNKDGYMTSLDSQTFNSAHEINDIKKARQLLKSVITSNPQSASGWIAAARVEELDGKIQQARNILAQACQNFLDNEDIWLEAARLSPPEKTKALLSKAVSLMPKSKKLWMQASRKEQDVDIKKQILLKGLEQIPSDIDLWKETIQLSNPEEAKALLYKATESIPDSTEMWLALAKLESYENARVVLNKAREHLPTDHTIWINAAKLEEAQGNTSHVDKIVSRAIKKLSTHGVKVKRDQWLKEAVAAEESGSIITCRAIIKETMDYGLEEFFTSPDESEKERAKVMKRVWIENAAACIAQNAIETARALYFNAIQKQPTRKSLWFNAIELEEKYGGKANVTDILTRAKDSTKHVFFYLKLAKHLWKSVHAAEQTRQVLLEGYKEHPDSEELVLAIQKFERENKSYALAEQILDQAKNQIPSNKVHMQAVQLQREVGNIDKALELATEGIAKYPTFHKLWLIKAQLLTQINHMEEARALYEQAIAHEALKSEMIIWLCYAQFESDQEAYTRARVLLQKARIRNATDEALWLAAIRMEIKCLNMKIAQNLLSQALQKCPTSGRLWALLIELEPAATRKAQVMNALKANDSDSDLFVAIAKVFWHERKAEKIRKWLKNAVTVNKDNGDAWAHLLRYELEFGTAESKADVLQEFREADPRHGEQWVRESKQVCNWRVDPCELLERVAKRIKLFD